MPLITRFDTPGGVRDIPADDPRLEDWLDTWHNAVNDMMNQAAARGPGSAGPEPSPIGEPVGEVYNPHETDVNPVGERILVWMGFPRGLLLKHRDKRQKAFELGDKRGAGERDTQIEYLEWRVTREEGSGKIKKVTFTTETPEYWEELFKFDPKRCAKVYGKLVGAEVREKDLADSAGNYNPLNKWNTSKGIVHYIVNSPANTLPVAISLAGGSVQLTGARHIRDNYELTDETFSLPTSADPRVQIDVNTLARKGLSVTCRDPISLYMGGWDDTGWAKPDGSPVGDYWRVVRGRPGAALRLEYEVPESEGFFVSDIKIGGRPITHGGHLAEHVTVLFGGLAGTRPA